MAARHISARAVLAVGFALAILISPAITYADSYQNCTVDQTKGSTSLKCAPNLGTPTIGGWNPLTSEQDLTLQNQYRH
ncbi:MAG: hypothetical protein JO044_11360 [Mycobacteriaceae bacterium]|nr:hypothetical protein [Mycobacteriaceae bacterium]MBV9639382.1 hypothetical protein [Mycobacteriaceae bacterium]